jgi:hypothetical protein
VQQVPQVVVAQVQQPQLLEICERRIRDGVEPQTRDVQRLVDRTPLTALTVRRTLSSGQDMLHAMQGCEICIHILINPVLQQLPEQQVMCIYSLPNRNRVSSVSTVTRLEAERPRNCVSILGGFKRHFCPLKSPDQLWGPRSLLYKGYRLSFRGGEGKRPGRRVNHPPASNTEVEGIVELYLYPLWAFMACSRSKFAFSL